MGFATPALAEAAGVVAAVTDDGPSDGDAAEGALGTSGGAAASIVAGAAGDWRCAACTPAEARAMPAAATAA